MKECHRWCHMTMGEVQHHKDCPNNTRIEFEEMKEWLIWSNEHIGWWKPNHLGYTKNPIEAGLYTFTEAMDICESANLNNSWPVPKESMVHRSNIKELQNEFDKELSNG